MSFELFDDCKKQKSGHNSFRSQPFAVSKANQGVGKDGGTYIKKTTKEAWQETGSIAIYNIRSVTHCVQVSECVNNTTTKYNCQDTPKLCSMNQDVPRIVYYLNDQKFFINFYQNNILDGIVRLQVLGTQTKGTRRRHQALIHRNLQHVVPHIKRTPKDVF